MSKIIENKKPFIEPGDIKINIDYFVSKGKLKKSKRVTNFSRNRT